VRLRLSAFAHVSGDRPRAVNVNAPVNGVVPDPSFGRITEIRSIGRGEWRGIDTSVRAQTPGRSVDTFVRYRYTRAWNDADGALSLPVDANDLDAEWGPASWDVPHRLFARVRVNLPLGIRANVWGGLSSGRPYTITTGFDDNNDTVFNDRPEGDRPQQRARRVAAGRKRPPGLAAVRRLQWAAAAAAVARVARLAAAPGAA
jgi:hypothetical protein